MSQSDSFIDEVNEAVRRDKLFLMLRKYGWIPLLLVLLVVGGAAWNEYRKATAQAEAEALGDSLLAALERPEPAARVAGLAPISADGQMGAVVALLQAGEELAAEDAAAAADLLRPLAADSGLPAVYSDLAAYKMVLLGDAAFAPEERAQVLDRLAQPGAPYRALALEQHALALAAEGRTADAVAAARALLEEPGLTQGLMQRVAQLIVALGEEPGDGNG